MKAYFYPRSIYTSVAAFADLWNNMTTRVFDYKTNRIVGVKQVPFTITSKEKIASILTGSDVNDVDPQKDNYLPRISANLSGLTWAPNRMRGKFEERQLNIEYDINGTTRKFQKDTQSMPWDLSFEMTVWAKYQTDAWQLFENIAVWFGPEMHVSFKERNFGLEHISKVTLDNVTPNIAFELGESERRIIQYNYTFTMETVLYKPITLNPEIKCANIKIANVPCEKIPFEGGVIYFEDDDTESIYDPQINAIIRQLDAGESYDLMLRHWESANNSMSSDIQGEESTYRPCVIDHCDDPIPPKPSWNPDDEPESDCGERKQPTRVVRDLGSGPDGHDTISIYSQEIIMDDNGVMSILSFRTTFDDATNEILEDKVIIPNEEYPTGNDLDGDGINEVY